MEMISRVSYEVSTRHSLVYLFVADLYVGLYVTYMFIICLLIISETYCIRKSWNAIGSKLKILNGC